VTRSLRRAPLALWLAPVLLWTGIALFLGDARQRAPLEPFILLAAALFIAERSTRVGAVRAARRDNL
jgi:hypothetical protein